MKKLIRKKWFENLCLTAATVLTAILLIGWCCERQEMREEVYTVRKGDTLSEIAEVYIQKNTGGERRLGEFVQGIVEHNPELWADKTVYPGQRLKITYWVEKN